MGVVLFIIKQLPLLIYLSQGSAFTYIFTSCGNSAVGYLCLQQPLLHKEAALSPQWWFATDDVFQPEMGRRVSRTDRRTDASPRISAVFFSSYKLPKTFTVTTLLLFGHVTLLCGTFLYIQLSEGPVQLLDCQIGRSAALVLPPMADQHRSDISPLTASETFTQRRRQRTGAGSPHSNGSVNGARIRYLNSAFPFKLCHVLVHL